MAKVSIKIVKNVNFSLFLITFLKHLPTRQPPLQALPWWTSLPPEKIPACANAGVCVLKSIYLSCIDSQDGISFGKFKKTRNNFGKN